jgi:hypothetical protein
MRRISKLILLIVILVVQANYFGSASSCSSVCPKCSWALSLDVEPDPIWSTATKTCCFSQCDHYPWCLEAFDWHHDYSITITRSVRGLFGVWSLFLNFCQPFAIFPLPISDRLEGLIPSFATIGVLCHSVVTAGHVILQETAGSANSPESELPSPVETQPAIPIAKHAAKDDLNAGSR